LPSPWPQYTWDATSGQYRGASGRYVPRTAVRQALDEAIDRAKVRIDFDARRLQSGAINLPEWQIRTENHLRSIHVMSAAIAAGGWAQATPADWSVAGNRFKKQLRFLERFARQIESGEQPLDGRFLNRAASYGSAGSGTYEAALRKRELATGLAIEERRRLHSASPCTSCLGYHALGWQEPGVLPGIGESCECGMRCRCTFQRRMARATNLKFVPSQRAIDSGMRTVWVDVKALDAGFQKDAGFAIAPGGAGAIPGRLAGFRAFLKKAKASGTPIEQPEVTVAADGAVSFTNGRHRFAVLRDLGVRILPVSVARAAVALVRRLFGAR
jgi:hypothetical protein